MIRCMISMNSAGPSSPDADRSTGPCAVETVVTPELSVIIPCRNGADFLDEAILSIQAQLHGPAEIIVVNDGSTDASPAIARARGVRVLDLPPSGRATARWTGIEAATGRLLAFCDADDLWPADRVAGQMAFMAAQGCEVSCGLSQDFLSPELAGGVAAVRPDVHYYRTFSAMMVTRALMARLAPLPLDGADLALPFFAALDDAGIAVARYDGVANLRRVHRGNHSRQDGLLFAEYARSLKGILDRRRRVAAAATDSEETGGRPCSGS